MKLALARWAWVAALASGFLVGAVYHLPLRVALQAAGAGALLDRAAPTGSITRWDARLAAVGELRFAASMPLLLTGRYGGRFDATLGGARLGGSALRAWDGALVVRDGTLDASLAPLALALGMPASMLEGQLALTRIAARWSDGALQTLACAGEVRGVRAGVGRDQLALGDLAIACQDAEGGPLAIIEDRGGPLAFRAELRFAPDGRYLLTGTAGARAGAPAVLVEVLPLLGRASGPDQVSFKYAGAFPAP